MAVPVSHPDRDRRLIGGARRLPDSLVDTLPLVPSGDAPMTISSPAARSTRYAGSSPLVFSENELARWRVGELRNMSGTGALWCTAGPLPAPSASVEFVVALPHQGRADRLVRCAGRIVRIEADRGAVASTIDDYEFVGDADAREPHVVPDWPPTATGADLSPESGPPGNRVADEK